jgi:hypothetical protein
VHYTRSIRYWCEAFKVLTKDDSPTEFGEQLLGNEGWDPYLEDPASLWLLHWKLLQPPCIATAWWITFNHFRQIEFTVDDLANTISDYCVPLSRSVASSSIRKDITCILRMYTSQTTKSGPTEDTIDCPFAELGLIQSTGESKHYTFRNGFKPNLPAEIILAACMEFIGGDKSQGTISISRLLYEPNSPGLVFKLTESVLCEAIESVAKKVTSIQLSDSAGLLQLSFTDSPATLAGSILGRYYQTSRNLPLSVGVL